MSIPKSLTYSLVVAIAAGVSSAGTYEQFLIVMLDEPVIELDQSLLNATLQSAPLTQIATEVLGGGERVDDLNLTAEIGAVWTGRQTRALVALSYDGEIPPAQRQEIWQAVVSEFSERLSNAMGRVENHRRMRWQQRIDRVAREAAILEEQVERLSNEIRAREHNQSPHSAEGLRERIGRLTEQIQELELKRVAWEARREATQEQIDRVRAAAEEDADDDPIINQLRRLVSLTEQQLENVKTLQKERRMTYHEVQEAEAAVAEARIRLLEQRQKLVDPGGASQLSALNARLADGMIEAVEVLHVQDELEDQLAQAKEQLEAKLSTSADAEIDNIRLGAAKQRLAESIVELGELRAEAPRPASVTVIPWVE